MTNQEQRLAIARDVLFQLQADRIMPTRGRYISFTDDSEANDVWNDQARDYLISRVPPSCECCAIGAGVISLVRLDNKATFDEIENGFEDEVYEIFQVDGVLMEIAFERGSGNNDFMVVDPEDNDGLQECVRTVSCVDASSLSVVDAVRARDLWPDVDVDNIHLNWDDESAAKERMRLVWQTVIDSDGGFDLDVAESQPVRTPADYGR